MGYNGLQWVKLGSTRVNEVLPGFTGFHLASSQSISTTSIHHVGPSDAGMRFNENLNCGFTCLFHFLFFFRSSVSFVPFGWIAGIFFDSRFFYFKFSFLFILFFLEKRAIHWPRDKWIRSSLLLLLLLMLLMLAMTLPFKSFSLFLRHEIIGFGTQQPSNSVKPGKTR